jgi:hypothetical protein
MPKTTWRAGARASLVSTFLIATFVLVEPREAGAATAPWEGGPTITITPPTVSRGGQSGGRGNNSGGGSSYTREREREQSDWSPGARNSAWPHVVASSREDEWQPEDGYAWTDPEYPAIWSVRWKPGLKSRRWPHVHAAWKEGRWHPDDCYDWRGNSPATTNMAVVWTAGCASSQNPHVVSDNREGWWRAADGYVWVVNPPQPGDFRVVWRAGLASDQYAHLVAGDQENTWRPEDGYEWEAYPPVLGQTGVVWQPGRPSRIYPHVVAGGSPETWYAADGYAWVTQPPPPGDLRVQWMAGHPSNLYMHVKASAVEGRWEPQDGYAFSNPNNPSVLMVEPLDADTPVEEHANVVWNGDGEMVPASGYKWASDPPATSDYAVVADASNVRNGFVGGTAWIGGYNVPGKTDPTLTENENRALHQQVELGNLPSEAIDKDRYHVVIGIAESNRVLEDLGYRVVWDQLAQGKATPGMQERYAVLKGRSFDELGCHSNGAMICLAALSNGDVQAKSVVLYGPQITPEALRQWQQKVIDKGIPVHLYLNDNDLVPGIAMALSPDLSRPGARMSYFLPDILDGRIHDLAPGITVTRFPCAGGAERMVSFACHDMAVYKSNRGCVSAGVRSAGPNPDARIVKVEPPPPC